MPQDSQGRYVPDLETRADFALASAARTTSTTSAAFSTSDVDSIDATITVSAVTGTNPTLDVLLETTVDGTNYNTVGSAYTQLTATGSAARVFGPLGPTSRWKWTIGGTATPTFTFAITATANR